MTSLAELLAVCNDRLPKSFYVNQVVAYSFNKKKTAKPWEPFSTMLLLPYGDHGSLSDVLECKPVSQKKKPLKLSPIVRLGLCLDVVSAVMDCQTCGVVHGRVCTENFWVFDVKEKDRWARHKPGKKLLLNAPSGSAVVARLANFDHSKIEDMYTADHIYERVGNEYDPPEGQAQKHQPISFEKLKAADDFALGILMMVICELPVPHVKSVCSALMRNSNWGRKSRVFRDIMPHSWNLVAYELMLSAALWLTEPNQELRPKSLDIIRQTLELALAVQSRIG